MVIIDDILISDDIFETQFVCNLSACKGACCVEGDFGAPVTKEEQAIIQDVYPTIRKYLNAKSIAKIEENGFTSWFEEPKFVGTTLMENGACVFLASDENGIAQCSFEKAYEANEIQFKKPISCHLYPIRTIENEITDFAAINYDQWEICSPACSLGKSLKMPLFRFVKEALIRKYSQSFYDQVEDYYAEYILGKA